jgi:nitrite reductase/ring-hydroxylating ferredoxin subunit
MSFTSSSAQAEGVAETHEIEIEFASDLKEGEMKELKVGPKDEDKVLISRYGGKLHAVGNYCSHFGAPLSTGLMFDDKVLCPWHAAAFNVVTGAVENAPGIDGLPTFTVSERDGKAYVTVPLVLPRSQTAPLAKRDPNDKRRYVIIGGGPAAVNCAEALRQSNYTGEILVISAEDMVSYDRTLLTKVLPSGDASKFKIRSDDFLKNADIDFRLKTRAESVDT